METKILTTVEANGSAGSISIEITIEDSCRIKFGSQLFEGTDLFAALIALRSTLETEQRRIACNGSRPDVFPSGMAREMSRGRMAYVLKIGTRPEREDLVDIFDPAHPMQIGSVADQQEYVTLWRQAL